jgi:eukaryotic-like serine/threonine-protein kinase
MRMTLEDRAADRTMSEPVTLLTAADSTPIGNDSSVGLPSDVLGQSAARLQILALLYALIYFLAGVFPMVALPEERARFVGNPIHWAPAVVAMVVAVLLVAVIRRVPPSRAMTLGLVFEVVSSYAIAAGEFGDAAGLEQHEGFLGLSWVAVWVVLFTIVAPTSPRRAALAALASVSSVAVVVGLMMITGAVSLQIDARQFFFGLVFPYLLVVAMAWVGAGVVYHLGTEVRRARELGSYRLEEKLGEGGMGEVWRARHRMLARPAAIKLIRPSPTGVSDQAARRFEREAQVIARLRSPHTVELFDFGVAADGGFYYAMELLEGLDAESLVRRLGPLPPERVIYLLRQVCHSLSEAHATGLVHRDIKPANVFLCRYGEEYDFVKVLDFGIVRAARDATETGGLETGEQRIEGTPAFMAPEQGLGGAVDHRADIYATGCLAYWLLTGELVFTAENPIALLMRHAHAPPEPPSSRCTGSIPRALDELVLACLAKEPERRPRSARELARQLAAVNGSQEWTQERAQRWWAERMEMVLA